MARIAYYRDVLKDDFSKRTAVAAGLLSEEILAAATDADYQWRDRIWNPVLTFWTFLIQVLHPGSACREAVAQVLAEQAVESRRMPVPIARLVGGYPSRFSRRPCTRWGEACRRRRKISTSGTAGRCGSLMDRVARCRIHRNFKPSLASPMDKSGAVGSLWLGWLRCSAGPQEQRWMG